MGDWSNITIGELVTWVVAVAGISCTVMEKLPNVISPWTRLLQWVGRALNGEVLERLEKLENKVQTLQQEEEERNIINCRSRIVRFGDELIHNVEHSKDHFDQTMVDIDTYEDYCRTHPDFKNSITEMTIHHIKEVYQTCMSKHTFI